MMYKNKLALGTVQFGLPYGITNTSGQTPESEVKEILKYAHEVGINTLDTAYGYGTSEEVLGRNHNHNFNIVTKFLPENKNETIQFQFQSSLNRLQVESIYGYLAHRPLDLIVNPKIWEYLQNLKENNFVEKIGFSFNTPEEYFLIKKTGFRPDLVQVPFNYFDKRFLHVMEELKQNDCEIHTRSAFLQGLFFKDIDSLSSYFDNMKPHIFYLQQTYKDDLQAVLLNYVLTERLIDKVVIGVENKLQLEQNFLTLNNAETLKDLEIIISNELLMPSNWPK